MEDDFSGRPKEEELEEGVENLLNHLVVFLLGAKHILQQLNQVRLGYLLGDLVIPRDSANQHDALKNDIVFCEAVHQMIVEEFDDAVALQIVTPLVRRDVNHGAEQLKQQVCVLSSFVRKLQVSWQIYFKCFQRLWIKLGDVAAHFE